jgi:hypothetical protein
MRHYESSSLILVVQLRYKAAFAYYDSRLIVDVFVLCDNSLMIYTIAVCCYVHINTAGTMMAGVDALYTMMQESGDAGLQAVAKDFNTCTPLNTTDDQWVFLSNVMGDLQVCLIKIILNCIVNLYVL